MDSFCQKYGKRNSARTSPVLMKCSESENEQRLVLSFSFSEEVIRATVWKRGERLDMTRSGDRLVFSPHWQGRKLSGQPQTAEFSFTIPDTIAVEEDLGFNVLAPNFWERYTTNGDRLELKLRDVNAPA